VNHFKKNYWKEYWISDIGSRPVEGLVHCLLPAQTDGRKLQRRLRRIYEEHVRVVLDL